VAIGTCDATNVAMRAARSRSVPAAESAAVPNSETAQRVHRRNDAQRVADAAPTHLTVLLRARTPAAGTRS